MGASPIAPPRVTAIVGEWDHASRWAQQQDLDGYVIADCQERLANLPARNLHIVLLRDWRRLRNFHLVQLEVWLLQRKGATVEET